MFLVNDHKIEPTIFPDGTSQIWKLPKEVLSAGSCVVTWEWTGEEADLPRLEQLSSLLNLYYPYMTLDIKYLPYGRQDKPISNDSTFALQVMIKILLRLPFSTIKIQDPHSVNLLPADSFELYYPEQAVLNTAKKVCADIICYPDRGASEKYSKIYPFQHITASKIRDPLTGNITCSEVHGKVKGKKVLIVDDICDGGATFIELTKKLKELGAEEVSLFVTHGIFSKGVPYLKGSGLHRIFTTKGEV